MSMSWGGRGEIIEFVPGGGGGGGGAELSTPWRIIELVLGGGGGGRGHVLGGDY